MTFNETPHQRCIECGEIKSFELFERDRRRVSRRQAVCRACQPKSKTMQDYDERAHRKAETRAQKHIPRETKGLATARVKAEEKYARRAIREAKAQAKAQVKAARQEARVAKELERIEAIRQLKQVTTKICRCCGEMKPVQMFPPNKRMLDGLNKRCIDCILMYRAARAEKAHISYITNIEKRRLYGRIYRQQNPWRQIEASHRRRARLKGNGGSYTREEFQALVEAQGGHCAYCQRVIKLTIDHIFPVSRGGTSYISNICLACRKCNSSKGAKTLDEWINRWYERKTR